MKTIKNTPWVVGGPDNEKIYDSTGRFVLTTAKDLAIEILMAVNSLSLIKEEIERLRTTIDFERVESNNLKGRLRKVISKEEERENILQQWKDACNDAEATIIELRKAIAASINQKKQIEMLLNGINFDLLFEVYGERLKGSIAHEQFRLFKDIHATIKSKL